MSAIDVQHRLISHLLAMPGRWNVILPGEAADVAKPRLVINNGAAGQRTIGGSGMTQVDAEISVTVEALGNRYSTEVDDQIKAIYDRFPVGLSLEGVDIESAPSIRPPLDLDGSYAVPVLISGRGYF